MKKITLALIALCLALPASTIAGQVYKWEDEQGNIHYSDKKPSNVESKKMKVSGGSQTSSRQSPQEKSSALDERKQQALEAQAEKLQAKNAEDELSAKCQAIRNNLAMIEQNARIRVEVDGEQRYLSPEEIEEKKAKFNDQLSKFCQ